MAIAARWSLGLVQDDGGHVVRAALLIEPARRLDLGHLLARGDGDAERLLHQHVLVLCGIEEIDPHRARFEGVAFSRLISTPWAAS